MEREQIIKEINDLYPADCQYEDTADIGKFLLEKAKIQLCFIEYYEKWQDYPDNVLLQYWNNCKDYSAQSLIQLFQFLKRYNILYN